MLGVCNVILDGVIYLTRRRKMMLLLALWGMVETMGTGIVVRSFPPTKGSIIKLVKAGVAVGLVVAVALFVQISHQHPHT